MQSVTDLIRVDSCLSHLCNTLHIDPPKFCLGQPVIIRWFWEDCERWEEEKGYIVGIATRHQEFNLPGWFYSILVVESSSCTLPLPTTEDFTHEEELLPWTDQTFLPHPPPVNDDLAEGSQCQGHGTERSDVVNP